MDAPLGFCRGWPRFFESGQPHGTVDPLVELAFVAVVLGWSVILSDFFKN